MAISDVTPSIKLPLSAPGTSPRTAPNGKAIKNQVLLSIPDEEFMVGDVGEKLLDGGDADRPKHLFAIALGR